MIIEPIGISGIGKSTTLMKAMQLAKVEGLYFVKSIPIKLIMRYNYTEELQDRILRDMEAFYSLIDHKDKLIIDDGFSCSLIYQPPKNLDRVKAVLNEHKDHLAIIYFDKNIPYKKAMKEKYRQWLTSDLLDTHRFLRDFSVLWLVENGFNVYKYTNMKDLVNLIRSLMK